MKQNRVKNRIWIVSGLLLLAVAMSFLAVGLARAGEVIPPRTPQSSEEIDVHSNYIPIQGRITDDVGDPLNGTYSVVFRIYDVYSGGVPLCESSKTIELLNGLFSTYINGVGCQIDGRQLYLGVEVDGDGEMTPRQYIDNAPYAWSLRPGAVISETLGNNAIVHIENSGESGRGLRAYASAISGVNYGIVGASSSPDGYGGYFYNNEGGVGLYGSANTGAAIVAGGSGIIKSAAPSYLWISGSDVRPFHQTDSTIIDMDTIGGALIYRGAVAGYKNIMLPITIPGTVFGQNVRVTALDIYWSGNTDFDAIVTVLMRRQTGVCASSSCYLTILRDDTDRVCDIGNNPTGCVLHLPLTDNNLLSADSGILYLTLELGFSGSSTWIDLGGIRLTLEHDG
jgi:hypothetical protein